MGSTGGRGPEDLRTRHGSEASPLEPLVKTHAADGLPARLPAGLHNWLRQYLGAVSAFALDSCMARGLLARLPIGLLVGLHLLTPASVAACVWAFIVPRPTR